MMGHGAGHNQGKEKKRSPERSPDERLHRGPALDGRRCGAQSPGSTGPPGSQHRQAGQFKVAGRRRATTDQRTPHDGWRRPAPTCTPMAAILREAKRLEDVLEERLHQIRTGRFTASDEAGTVEVTLDGQHRIVDVFIAEGALRKGISAVEDAVNEAWSKPTQKWTPQRRQPRSKSTRWWPRSPGALARSGTALAPLGRISRGMPV